MRAHTLTTQPSKAPPCRSAAGSGPRSRNRRAPASRDPTAPPARRTVRAHASRPSPLPAARTSCPSISNSTDSDIAESALSSTTRTRRAVTGVTTGASCSRVRQHAERQHDRELAAAPGPGAADLDAPAVQLDQTLRNGEPDAESALRTIERLVALHEEIEHVRQRLRVDAGAFVANARSARHRRAGAAVTWMRAPSGENFAAFDNRLPITCVSLTGSPSTSSGCGGGSNVTLCRRVAISGRAPSSACSMTSCTTRLCVRSSILPLVMRATSSRSSTSRARCDGLSLQDAAHLAHRRRLVRAGAEISARC